MLNVAPSAIFTPHLAQGASGRGPSQRIWNHLGVNPQPDGTTGWLAFSDDFLGYNTLSSTGAFGAGPYYGFIENSSTITNRADEIGGVVRVTTGATADNSCGFTLGQIGGIVKAGVGSPGSVTNYGSKLLFEARIARVGSVADGECSFFVGLSKEGRAADNGLITDAHALAGVDAIGFWSLDADGDSLKMGYNVDSGTAQVIDSTAIAADTFVKVGLVYDPSEAAGKFIKFYVNGVEQDSYVTKALVGASTFPLGEELTLCLDIKTDGAAAEAIDIDWWAVAQAI